MVYLSRLQDPLVQASGAYTFSPAVELIGVRCGSEFRWLVQEGLGSGALELMPADTSVRHRWDVCFALMDVVCHQHFVPKVHHRGSLSSDHDLIMPPLSPKF